MNSFWERIKSEPAVVAMLINQAFLVGMAFGVHISAQQLVEVNGLLALVLTFITRQTVAPVSKMTTQEVNEISARPPAGTPPTS
jgi:hypothetical protein